MNIEGYVAVGSNLGDRLKTILMAVEMLDDLPGVSVLHVSTLLETDAVGDVDQPDFRQAVHGQSIWIFSSGVMKSSTRRT